MEINFAISDAPYTLISEIRELMRKVYDPTVGPTEAAQAFTAARSKSRKLESLYVQFVKDFNNLAWNRADNKRVKYGRK